ncbi:hypothetical protein DVK44_24095 [Streptomyces paludis]|uniref:Uncharacterized protein n=1 Tax=Streptomyces paludis TaxID=2282738 RepID=A0A345I1P1_9ACTN|nr:hypothetical protein DVK44_24095 [Streptomyces paludis]
MRTPPRLHPLRVELVRGIGPWAGLAVAMTVAVTMYGKAPAWQGRWGDVVSLLRVAALLLGGPLAVATGCWQGGRDRRRGTGELLASLPRAPLSRTVCAVAPAALWPPAGYLVAAAGCLLATWPYTSGRPPFLLLVVADAVALAALGALGFVLGRLIAWRLAAPLLAVVTYAGLGILSYQDSGVRGLNPADEHVYHWDQPVWWLAPVSMVWTAGPALAALLALAARHRTVALFPLAAAGAAALLLVRTGDGLWLPDPEAARRVCDSGTPQVCVTAVDRKLLPDVSAALAGVNAKLRGVPGAPVRWIDAPGTPGPGREQVAAGRGVAVRDAADRAVTERGEVRLPTPADSAARGRLTDPFYAVSAVGQLFWADCELSDGASEQPHAERAAAVDEAVQRWLAPRPGSVPYWSEESERYGERLAAMGEEEGRAYLARYLAADPCAPAGVPVP